MGEARRERAAVIGSGISGLTAAYVLQKRHDVTLFEADNRLGGHTHTHDVVTPDNGTMPVDSGFIVYNERTYPLLCRLFAELGVTTRQTEMSMSIRCEGCGLEYAGGRGTRGVFAHSRSLVRPRFLRLLAEVPRFHRLARAALAQDDDEMTLGEFLDRGRYSPYFVSHFLVPIVSSVWSMPPDGALEYPARYLFRFLENHGMLSLVGSPTWRTVNGGSRTYVERLAKNLTAVATSTPVRAVANRADCVEVRTDDDEVIAFKRVVIATHADAALALLVNPSARQLAVLGSFQYSRNETWMHTDAALLPRGAGARASWNFLLPTCASADHALVSYDMNRLQGLESVQPHLVTLNATHRIDPEKVLARMTYEHPTYTAASVNAQLHLPELNDGKLAFAGSYHGWGFHEDGCRSGVRAARSLDVTW